jgi:hypothetical protein
MTRDLEINSEIVNPFNNCGEIISIVNVKETYRIAEEVITNLGDGALNELLGGYDNDISKLYKNILKETYNFSFGNFKKDDSYSYLSLLTASKEETYRIENFNYFVVSVMPEVDMFWYLLEWGQWLMRYKRLLILAARGHSKTYYVDNAYPIWNMYRYRSLDVKKNRLDLAICEKQLIITSGDALSKTILEIIKTTVENNDILRNTLYNERKWNIENIISKNGARINISSLWAKLRGGHPGIIICDDILDDEVIYSKTQREKAINRVFGVVTKMILPKGRINIIGTPFHDEDLYAKIESDPQISKQWQTFKYPAIYPNGKILCPERFSYEYLMNERGNGELLFAREYLLQTVTSGSSIFPFEILRRSYIGMEQATLVTNKESYFRTFNRIVIGTDFAMSSSVGADYVIFLTFGITNDGKMYLMNMYRNKGISFAQQIAVLKALNLNFRPDAIGVETNQSQIFYAQELKFDGLPVVEHVTGKEKNDFKVGLPGLSILFENDRMRFPRGDTESRNTSDLICSEFNSIAFTDKGLCSVGGHDDTCMAIWQADIARKTLIAGVGMATVDLENYDMF